MGKKPHTNMKFIVGGTHENDEKILTLLMAITLVFAALPLAEHNAEAAGEPSITGSRSMTLTVGYAATSTDVFTVTGEPAPTIFKFFAAATFDKISLDIFSVTLYYAKSNKL